MNQAQQHEEVELAFVDVDDETVERVPALTRDLAAIIDERNRWYDTGDFGDALESEVHRRCAHMLYELLLYCTDKCDPKTLIGVMRISLRFIMFIWVFAPQLLGDKLTGKVPSLHELALPFKRTRCWASTIAEEISNKFKFFSRNQKSQSSRSNYAAGAKRGWVKRNSKMKKPVQKR